jgi:hypothetical protein
MIRERKRDLFLGAGLLCAVVLTVWFVVGREAQGAVAAAPTKTIERPAINPEEQKTMPSEENVPVRPEATTQEGMLREETLRTMRDNAIKNLKEGN